MTISLAFLAPSLSKPLSKVGCHTVSASPACSTRPSRGRASIRCWGSRTDGLFRAAAPDQRGCWSIDGQYGRPLRSHPARAVCSQFRLRGGRSWRHCDHRSLGDDGEQFPSAHRAIAWLNTGADDLVAVAVILAGARRPLHGPVVAMAEYDDDIVAHNPETKRSPWKRCSSPSCWSPLCPAPGAQLLRDASPA
jgi:hypothetical protein